MGIGNVSLKLVRALFANPFAKDAKKYTKIPMGVSLLYAGVQGGRALNDIRKGKHLEAGKTAMNGYVGLAAAAGSIMGPGGALLFGGGMYVIVNSAKKSVVA